MATTGKPVQGTQERRSLEAYLSMPLGGEYNITLYRQVVLRDVDGKPIAASRDDRPIQRTATQVKDMKVTVGGKEITGATAMAILAAFFDKLDDEDQAKLAPVPAQETAP